MSQPSIIACGADAPTPNVPVPKKKRLRHETIFSTKSTKTPAPMEEAAALAEDRFRLIQNLALSFQIPVAAMKEDPEWLEMRALATSTRQVEAGEEDALEKFFEKFPRPSKMPRSSSRSSPVPRGQCTRGPECRDYGHPAPCPEESCAGW
jgi:hypothetical protein